MIGSAICGLQTLLDFAIARRLFLTLQPFLPACFLTFKAHPVVLFAVLKTSEWRDNHHYLFSTSISFSALVPGCVSNLPRLWAWPRGTLSCLGKWFTAFHHCPFRVRTYWSICRPSSLGEPTVGHTEVQVPPKPRGLFVSGWIHPTLFVTPFLFSFRCCAFFILSTRVAFVTRAESQKQMSPPLLLFFHWIQLHRRCCDYDDVAYVVHVADDFFHRFVQ